jgi:hypothetical protein
MSTVDLVALAQAPSAIEELRVEVARLQATIARLESGKGIARWVRLNKILEEFDLSRRAFYDWLADPGTGLTSMVSRPGPGNRPGVWVNRFEFERWWASQAGR